MTTQSPLCISLRLRASALKYYTAAAILCSTGLVYAQPAPPPDQRSSVTAEIATTVTVPVENPDYVEIFEQFDASLNNGRGLSDADNSNGQLAWLQSYQMLAYMRMYEATSQTKWLDKVATQFDRVLECRDDRLGRVDVHAKQPLKGWGTATYDKAGWHVFVVHTGMICQGPVEFVREVKANPDLANDYGATATRFLAEIEAMVADADQFFRTNDAGEGWYDNAGFGIVPLNMSNALGSVIVELSAITGKPEYREKARAIATYFRNCLRDNGKGGWNWAYWAKTSKDPVARGEDISHAALNVDFAARGTREGIVFTRTDMEKFGQTWLKKVSKGNGRWSAYVDGTATNMSYIPQAPGRWLTILPYLEPETARAMYADVASAFASEPINVPSRGLGLANLAKFSSLR